jgi:tyrosinase
MASFIRKNAWNNGGTFANPDLLWYAKGVGVMQSRQLDDPNSWWFFGAIHGQGITTATDTTFHDWAVISGPPQVPVIPLPSQNLQALYWDQCQHQTWYFTPWHRGYLIALEAQIRAAVVSLDGPSDWALPYWNYFGQSDQHDEHNIPPAFTEQNLPDGTPNPLFVKARRGPRNDDVIFVTTNANENCQNDTDYTDHYGGPPTQFFSHSGDTNGDLESNPHNQVHGDVGGGVLSVFSIDLQFAAELNASQLTTNLHDVFQQNGFSFDAQARVIVGQTPSGPVWVITDGSHKYFIVVSDNQQMLDVYSPSVYGLMSDPDTSALDPIFYLHHCNIDRMWAKWNEAHDNPTDPNWLNGPKTFGNREFAMPMPDGTSWVYTPADVNRLSQLDYGYEDQPVTILPQPSLILAQRLMKFGVAPAAASAAQGANMDGGQNAELLGANEEEALPIKTSGVRATVKLDSEVRGRMFASLANAAATNSPDRVYLRLENVRGTIDAFKLNVSVNQQNVGTVALFGLRRASLKEGEHGGAGLTYVFDITDIMDNLFLANAVDVDSLDVRIEPNTAVPAFAQLTVGRVSVYRQGAQ